MSKSNKLRYQVKNKPQILITLTGKIFLQYRDDELLAQAVKGDLLCYPHNEALHSTRQGDYDATGFTGYFKLDVFDGKFWKPVLVNHIFLEGEHHFSKKECPIDTYILCEELLHGWTGKKLQRTYREHYTPEGVAETAE